MEYTTHDFRCCILQPLQSNEFHPLIQSLSLYPSIWSVSLFSLFFSSVSSYAIAIAVAISTVYPLFRHCVARYVICDDQKRQHERCDDRSVASMPKVIGIEFWFSRSSRTVFPGLSTCLQIYAITTPPIQNSKTTTNNLCVFAYNSKRYINDSRSEIYHSNVHAVRDRYELLCIHHSSQEDSRR